MLYPLRFSPLASLVLLVYTAHAGTPPKYPFDKPSFGTPLCDQSLPKPPRENPVLKKAALEKIDFIVGDLGGRRLEPSPAIPPNALVNVPLSPIVASEDPGQEGVLPTNLFQYWEKPIQYQVFTSAVTTNLVLARDPTTRDKINDLIADVLRTCCQFGFDGAAFVKFSETQGDYIEVNARFSTQPPPTGSGFGSMAVESNNEGPRGFLGLPLLSRIGNRPPRSRSRNSTSGGGMVLSSSRQDLLGGVNSPPPSPATSGELSGDPRPMPLSLEGPFAFQASSPPSSDPQEGSLLSFQRSQSPSSQEGPSALQPSSSRQPNPQEEPFAFQPSLRRPSLQDIPIAFRPGSSRRISFADPESSTPSARGPTRGNPFNSTSPPTDTQGSGAPGFNNELLNSFMSTANRTGLANTADRVDLANTADRVDLMNTADRFNPYLGPEEQVLLRQCRDAMVEINLRGQTADERQDSTVQLRETCCKWCVGFINNHQGITGCCIMTMVFLSTVFTILNYVHPLHTGNNSSGLSPMSPEWSRAMPLGMPPGMPPGSG